MIYGVSEKETAHISCTVDSNPKADSFFWTLNTTAGHSEIPGAMSTDMAGASLLSYKPMSQVCCDEFYRKLIFYSKKAANKIEVNYCSKV